MHHTQALKTLLQCLEELTGTVEIFGQEQKLHEVEKDLVLYRGRLLYEAILKLPTEAAVAPKIDLTEATVVVEASVVVENQSAEEVLEAVPFALADEIDVQMAETAEEGQREQTPEDEAAPIGELTATTEVADEMHTEEASSEDIPTIPRAKSIRPEKFSIAEVLRLSGDKDLILTHLKLKPIQDLKSGIGLNEKFLFIRELFENDHHAYAQAVEALNNSENLGQAEAYIADELLPLYGWELEREALLNFLHLILRRFSDQ